MSEDIETKFFVQQQRTLVGNLATNEKGRPRILQIYERKTYLA